MSSRLIAILLCASQSIVAVELTLSQAIENSLKNYPTIKISQEQINAAAAGIQLARTAYLPRVDALAQFNRATRNNVFGLLLPQNVISSMSGPVIGTNNLGSVWGSAVGGLVTWEPFDFGLRRANVAVAQATRAKSQAAMTKTEFDVAVAAADAYLTVVAAQETVRAAHAGVDRADTIAKTIRALVKAELRPGADQSRAEAELAAARTQLAQAEQAMDVSRASLAQFTGENTEELRVVPGGLVQLPHERGTAAFSAAANPAVVEQNATVEQARKQLSALERTYFPKFYLQGTAYARGTGAELNGTRLGGFNGLAPTYQDYAIGVTVTFPVMDYASLRAREAAQNAQIRSEVARQEQIVVDLRAQWNQAIAILSGARRIAANTPVQVSAARAAGEQATARYKAGLSNVDEVAEAERLLTQAEIDDVLAKLGVWRGLLGIATAAGDIEPFVTEAMR